ncbi:MAG: DUF6431 domain-containing protein, partial [Lachnospiraceae bacterium]|nr:DUF6431 domain-containing protein [Lachnospiraceae bacterium]
CRCDVFYRHGTYQRYFVFIPYELQEMSFQADSLSVFDAVETQSLTILRIRCTGCGQTHAILPEDIVPFHAFSLMLQLLILSTVCKDYTASDNQEKTLHQTSVLSWPFLHALLLTFQSYHSRMRHVLRVKSIYTSETAPSDPELLELYLFHEQHVRHLFLQVFSIPLFLTRQNTVSYPIRIIVR